MVTSPEVSWLFFKARAKRPYLSHTGRASNAEKQPTGPGPEGCDENGPAAALLVGHISIQICPLLTPCRRPILIATKGMLFRRQDTSLDSGTGFARVSAWCVISPDSSRLGLYISGIILEHCVLQSSSRKREKHSILSLIIMLSTRFGILRF